VESKSQPFENRKGRGTRLNEFVGHGTPKPRTFETESVGHPKKPSQLLCVDYWSGIIKA